MKLINTIQVVILILLKKLHYTKKDVVAGFKLCLKIFMIFQGEKGEKLMNVFLKFIINMQKEILMNKLEVIIKALDDKLAEDIVAIDTVS